MQRCAGYEGVVTSNQNRVRPRDNKLGIRELEGTERKRYATECLVRRYGSSHFDKLSTGSRAIGMAGEAWEEVIVVGLGRTRGRTWFREDVIVLLDWHLPYVHGRGSRDGGALCRWRMIRLSWPS